MPGVAWQLLWWLISRMDADAKIHDGWRATAAKEMKRDRTHLAKAAEVLQARGLIETAPRKRYVRIIVKNIQG